MPVPAPAPIPVPVPVPIHELVLVAVHEPVTIPTLQCCAYLPVMDYKWHKFAGRAFLKDSLAYITFVIFYACVTAVNAAYSAEMCSIGALGRAGGGAYSGEMCSIGALGRAGWHYVAVCVGGRHRWARAGRATVGLMLPRARSLAVAGEGHRGAHTFSGAHTFQCSQVFLV